MFAVAKQPVPGVFKLRGHNVRQVLHIAVLVIVQVEALAAGGRVHLVAGVSEAGLRTLYGSGSHIPIFPVIVFACPGIAANICYIDIEQL